MTPVPLTPGRSAGVRLLVIACVLALFSSLLPSTSASAADAGLTRLHWSANIGRIASTGPWARKLDYTLTPSNAYAGRVSVTFRQFDPGVAGTRTTIGYAGPCNGVATCSIFTPTPSVSRTWVGSYTFTGTDNVGTLAITWDDGNAESWTLAQARGNTLGAMTLRSASYQGSDPNRGYGYGSKQPFSYYKSAGMVDSVTAVYRGASDVVVSGGTPQFDRAWDLNVGGMNGSAAHPKGLYMLQSPTMSYPECKDLQHITGTVYTMWVNNADRTLTQNNWRRCLVQKETGEYRGDLHMVLASQVIDDSKNMVGIVGVESSASGGYTLALVRAIQP